MHHLFPYIDTSPYCNFLMSACSQNYQFCSVIYFIDRDLISVMQLLQCDWYKNLVEPKTGSVFTLRTLFQIRPIYNIPKLLQPELFFVIYKYLCKMLWYFRNICWSRLDKWTNRIWSRCWYRIDVQQTRVFRSVRARGPRTGPWRTCVFFTMDVAPRRGSNHGQLHGRRKHSTAVIGRKYSKITRA